MSRPLSPIFNEEIRYGQISPRPRNLTHGRTNTGATLTDQRDTATGTGTIVPGGLVAHYVSTFDADPIQTWSDETATGADLTQPTLGSRPVQSGGLALFDGLDDAMKTATDVVPFNGLYTIFVKYNHIDDVEDIFANVVDLVGDQTRIMRLYYSNIGNLEHQNLLSGIPIGSVKYYDPPSNGVPHIVTARAAGTNATTILRYDGVQQVETSNGYTVDLGALGDYGTLHVGGYPNSTDDNAHIAVYEIRVYNYALSDAGCAVVEALMA